MIKLTFIKFEFSNITFDKKHHYHENHFFNTFIYAILQLQHQSSSS